MRERDPPARPPARGEPKSRSHAAIPVTIVLVIVGVALGGYTLLGPLVLGGVLFVSGFSLLSSRINPLSAHFYSHVKASWSAVGVVFLGAFLLFVVTYYLWTSRAGPVVPHL